jgi:hypothetical protein
MTPIKEDILIGIITGQTESDIKKIHGRRGIIAVKELITAGYLQKPSSVNAQDADRVFAFTEMGKNKLKSILDSSNIYSF